MDTHRPYRLRPQAPFIHVPLHPDRHLIFRLYDDVMTPGAKMPRAALQLVRDQYDNSIYHADRFVGMMLAFLAAKDLLDDTIVVVTSDHGEYFGEHRLVEHSKDIYDPGVHVPLLIKGTGKRKPDVVREPVSGADIPHLIGRRLPGDLGRAVRERFPARKKVITENYFTRGRDLENEAWGHRFDRIRTGYYADGYKLIASSDTNHELYHLQSDPDEQRNLAESQPERLERMIRELSELKSEGGRDLIEELEDDKNLTPEEVEELEALGYL